MNKVILWILYCEYKKILLRLIKYVDLYIYNQRKMTILHTVNSHTYLYTTRMLGHAYKLCIA